MQGVQYTLYTREAVAYSCGGHRSVTEGSAQGAVRGVQCTLYTKEAVGWTQKLEFRGYTEV